MLFIKAGDEKKRTTELKGIITILNNGMRKLRKVGKMNYYNDTNRTLFESIVNDHVLSAIKTLISNNDLENVILIGGLAASYYSKPFRSTDIDILVRDKKAFRYFPNNQYRNGTKLDIYDIKDLGLTLEQFDDIKSSSVISDNIKIANPSHLMWMFFKDHMNFLRPIGFLFSNCFINKHIIIQYLTNEEYEKYEYFLFFSKKDYRMTYVKTSNEIVKFKLFEGNTGFAQIDAAFYDWVNNTIHLNQVLIGGVAFFNYIQESDPAEVDYIFLSENEIPSAVNEFEKVSSYEFRHVSLHVKIETLSPECLDVNPELIKTVFDEAYNKGKYKIASPSSIIALMLERLEIENISDLKNLVDNYQVDITMYLPFLSEKAFKNIDLLKNEIGIDILNTTTTDCISPI